MSPGEDAAAGGADWIVGRRPVEEAFVAASAERVPAPSKAWIADEPATVRWWTEGPGEAARRLGTLVARVPRAALDRMAGGAVHQGVVAQAPPIALVEIEALLETVARPALLVLADGIEDPRNLGAIVRSAAGAGAGGVVVPERRSAPVGPTAAKAAAGAFLRIPIARCKSVQRGLEALVEAGVWTLGLEAGAGPVWEADLARPTCIVVGGEGRGLSRLARERCDALAGIPLSRGVESLNASVAASIALFEAVRQRRPGAAR